MTNTTLYHAPGACSRVTLTALEKIGATFSDIAINTRQNQQNSPEYLAINAMGKVPALKIGSRVFTENAAILHFLHQENPSAGLIPQDKDIIGPNEGLQDLVWCSSTLHPMTRQVRAPARFTTADPDKGGPEKVREDGINKYQPILQRIADRVADGNWWYGSSWSIVDTYINWNYTTAEKGGLDLTPFPALKDHADRVAAEPAFIRAREREDAATKKFGSAWPTNDQL